MILRERKHLGDLKIMRAPPRETVREQLERDPEFRRAMADPRHWRHQEFQRRWQRLIEAEAPHSKGEHMQELRTELDQFMSDPENRKAIMDRFHPRHAEVVSRRASLIENRLAAEGPSSSGTPPALPPSPPAKSPSSPTPSAA